MAISLVCDSARDGLPEGCKKGNPIRSMAGAFLVSKGTSFTYSEASALTNYTSKVISKTLLPAHNVFDIEDSSTDEMREESSISRIKINHPGFRGYVVYFDYTGDQHQALIGWMDSNMDIIPYDILGTVYFAPNGVGNVKGFGIDLFNVRKFPVSVGDSGMKTIVEIQESDPEEMNYFKYITPKKNTAVADRWQPTSVKTISKAVITQVGAVAANEAVFTVSLDSNSYIEDGALASRAATGLLLANFVFKDGTGSVVTANTVTETSGTQGEYTATFTTYTGGTVVLDPQASDENLYESDATTLS